MPFIPAIVNSGESFAMQALRRAAHHQHRRKRSRGERSNSEVQEPPPTGNVWRMLNGL